MSITTIIPPMINIPNEKLHVSFNPLRVTTRKNRIAWSKCNINGKVSDRANVGFRLNKEVKKCLKAFARKTGKSQSEIVEDLLTAHMQEIQRQLFS